MKKIIFSIACFLMASPLLVGQDWTFSIQSYQVINASFQNPIRFNHFGGALDYGYEVQQLDLSSNISFRSIDWGNQVSIGQGISFEILKREKWKISHKNNVQINLPLYYNKLLLGYGITSGFEWSAAKLQGLVIYYGISFNHLPDYLEWSQRKLIFEGAFSIGWTF